MMEKKLTIAITAGGTGGHVFPAEAVLDACLARGLSPVLITDHRGDALFSAFENVPRLTLSIYHSDKPWALPLKWLSLIKATISTVRFLKKTRPQKLLSFGGYPTLPAVCAAYFLKIPILLHEQNAVLGRVNRWCAHLAHTIALSFEETQRIPGGCEAKTLWTGLPLRQSLTDVPLPPYRLPEKGEKWRILVIGGSQGAAIFSDIVPKAIRRLNPALQERLHIVQQVRPGFEEITEAAYVHLPVQITLQTFFPHMAAQLGAAHLIIARSGAGSVFEVAYAGRPAIFVPLPTATDQHQLKNAETAAKTGGAWVMQQEYFTVDALAAKLTVLLEENCDTLAIKAAGWKAFPQQDAAPTLVDLLTA